MKKLFFITSWFAIAVFNNNLQATTVGFKDLIVGHGLNTFMAVWYPTNVHKSESTRVGAYVIDAQKNAPIKKGKYPLILTSHGTGGHYLAHRSYAQALAKNGFIVVSIEHPGDNAYDQSSSGGVKNIIQRPKLISAAIDYLIQNSIFRSRIDSQKIGVIGHSLGGYTALAVSGANIGLGRFDKSCKTPIGSACQVKASQIDNLLSKKSFFDKRIKAAVVMAPVAFVFDQTSFKDIKARVQIYLPQYDSIVNSTTNVQFFKQAFPQANIKISVNANHFSYIAPFPESMQEMAGIAAKDRQGFNRTIFHKEIAEEIMHFFKDSL